MALPFGRKTMIGLGVAAGVAGLHKGLKSQNTSAHIYDTLFDNPNYDTDVFGTHVGVRELLAPVNIPVLRSMTRLGAIRSGGFSGLTAAAQEGFINKNFVSDYARYGSYYGNPMPDVSGSLVFGLHNASQGG